VQLRRVGIAGVLADDAGTAAGVLLDVQVGRLGHVYHHQAPARPAQAGYVFGLQLGRLAVGTRHHRVHLADVGDAGVYGNAVFGLHLGQRAGVAAIAHHLVACVAQRLQDGRAQNAVRADHQHAATVGGDGVRLQRPEHVGQQHVGGAVVADGEQQVRKARFQLGAVAAEQPLGGRRQQDDAGAVLLGPLGGGDELRLGQAAAVAGQHLFGGDKNAAHAAGHAAQVDARAVGVAQARYAAAKEALPFGLVAQVGNEHHVHRRAAGEEAGQGPHVAQRHHQAPQVSQHGNLRFQKAWRHGRQRRCRLEYAMPRIRCLRL